MPLLAYCLTETEPEIPAMKIPAVGVQGASMEARVACGLRCFVSRHEPGFSVYERTARETALAFHSVLRQIFRQVAVIPFRFPTIVVDENEISAVLRDHAVEYKEALLRLRNKVQMELLLSFPEAKRPGEGASRSGTVYLQQQGARRRRLAVIAEEFRRAGVDWIESWRDRPVGSGIRCYALLGRDSMELFVKRLATVPVPAHISARVSGPWPATEFLKGV